MYRILCYGDSNTYGYDPRSYLGGRYPSSARWTSLLSSATGYEVINLGQNGRTIPSHDAFLSSQLTRQDILVIMLGSNDLLQGLSAQEASVRMEAFIKPLLSRCKQLLLIAPPPMQRGQWVSGPRLLTESAALKQHYASAAQQLRVSFADAGQWNVELTFDGVHFSEHGHRNFAAGLQGVLEDLLCSLD